MNTRLWAWWESLRSSYWFIPTVMAAMSAALALVLLYVDWTFHDRWIDGAQWVYSGGVEGARAVLSAIAGSMITVAGVVFSITIVALTLASSQFGPRLLRNFMRDVGNQVVLGTFIATYIFCMLVLRSVGIEKEYVPQVSVSTAVALGICSIGVLIYFIHHAAASIQAPLVIAAVAAELDQAIDAIYPEEMGHAEPPPPPPSEDRQLPADFDYNSVPVASRSGGFIQGIDEDGLMALATKHDVIVRLDDRPGHFIIDGHELARVYPKDRVTPDLVRRIADAVVTGGQRTLTQDVEFAVNQLVEVAVRALSPGVNDPFTAIDCIDRIWQSLARLCRRRIPSPFRVDDRGDLRVVAYPVRCDQIIEAAFDQIRQNGDRSVAVTIRLLEVIAKIAPHLRRVPDRDALLRQATMIASQARRTIAEEQDLHDVERRYHGAVDALAAAKV